MFCQLDKGDTQSYKTRIVRKRKRRLTRNFSFAQTSCSVCEHTKKKQQLDFAIVHENLAEKQPAYFLVRLGDSKASSEWIFLCYVPDVAPIRQKMIYAATRASLTKDLGDSHFTDSIYGTNKVPLSRSQLLDIFFFAGSRLLMKWSVRVLQEKEVLFRILIAFEIFYKSKIRVTLRWRATRNIEPVWQPPSPCPSVSVNWPRFGRMKRPLSRA